MSKENMANLVESPPFMPMDDDACEIWAILQMLGYYHVKIIKYEKHVQLVFTHKYADVETCKTLDLRWAFRKISTKDIMKLLEKAAND